MQEIEKIIAELKSKGVDENQILQALQTQLSPEDFEKAKQILMANQEKQQAEKMFGLKFI